MRYHPSLKSVLKWTSLGIFFFLACAAFVVSLGNDGGDWTTTDLEQGRAVDSGDIETRITPQRSGSGVVWGTVQPTPGAEPVTPPQPTLAVPATPAPATPALPSVAPTPLNLPGAAPATPALPSAAPTAPTLPGTTPSLPAPAVAALQPVPLPAARTPTPGRYLLQSARQRGSTDLVETLLEVTGEAIQITSDLRETRERMEVVAGFRYEERIEQFSLTGQLSSVRQYNLAKSRMRIGDNIRTPELSSNVQTIVGTLERDKVVLFSPHGSLRGEQLLLIEDIPGNTLTIDRLLPNREVAIGESWTISDSVLRSFLSVDAVLSSNVEAILTAVADNMAMVEIVGDVSGIYLGATTEMSVRAQFQFDLEIKRINWLGAIIQETRSIGHVGPGLEHTARLQVKISPLDAPLTLTDATMTTISTRPNPDVLQLQYDGGRGPWRFSHDRTWYVYQDDPQTTVLRKLVNGELVAQCNIADMGTVDVRTMTTLERFQQDLVAGLGNHFGRIAAAAEYEDQRGNRVFKVLLDGMVDDLALRWIYHLITDSNGRQTVVVFVVEASMLDQFSNADEVLLDTYRMGR